MKTDKNKSPIATAAELRQQAEELLSAKTTDLYSNRTMENTQRLVHELEVHQIELEMQNAELRQARDEIDSALENYTDLFDFAPVGYFTLDRNGAISAVNLCGASLLGIERARLIGRSFAMFIAVNTRPLFSDFLNEVFASNSNLSCEVSLSTKGNSPLFVRVKAVTSSSGEECRIALMDITERKRDEELIQRYIEELRTINEELTRFNNASVGRELRMIELKREINELYVQSGQPPRYPLDFEKE
jgi:PAS domain S-box-containing protein